MFALSGSPPGKDRRNAIVIGGGPVGIATALTLADAPHFYDVKLFETSVPTKYDPTRAYLYNINNRGLKLVKRFKFLEDRLKEKGVCSTGVPQIVKIPADKTKPIPQGEDITAVSSNVNEDDLKASYWIPRHTMTEILYETVQAWNKERIDQKGKIDVCSGNEFLSLDANDKSKITVKIRDSRKEQVCEYDATLVVGADGVNSKVRECLATDTAAFSEWDNIDHKKFVPKKWVSPSTGLKLKALQLPPKFKIPDNDSTFVTSKSQGMYVFLSKNKKPRDMIRLGLLPMKDDDAIRPVNIITRPDHDVWTIKDGSEMRQWFQKAFPRLNFGEDSDLVSSEEWERFAKAKGTSFPHCQYSPGLQVSSNDGECGVVLVGDAVHAFPPDIGQGINAGLEDALVLDKSLRGNENEKKSLGSSLRQYEKERLPDVSTMK